MSMCIDVLGLQCAHMHACLFMFIFLSVVSIFCVKISDLHFLSRNWLQVEELALTNLLRLQKEREMQAQTGTSDQKIKVQRDSMC